MAITIGIEAFYEVQVAAQAGFGGDVEEWTTQWVAKAPQEPGRQIVAHSILLTERLAGCGGAQTGLLAAEIGMRICQEVAFRPEPKRVQYLAGMETACMYLAQRWRSSRQMVDERRAHSVWREMLGDNPQVQQVVQYAIERDVRTLLPRLPGDDSLQCRAGIAVPCRPWGVVPIGVVLEPEVFVFKAPAVDKAWLASVASGAARPGPVVLIAPEVTYETFAWVGQQLGREVYVLSLPSVPPSYCDFLADRLGTIAIDVASKPVAPGYARAVCFDLDGVAIYDVPDATGHDIPIGMVTEFDRSDPNWRRAEQSLRIYRHSQDAGIIDLSGPIPGVQDIREHLIASLLPDQQEGAQAIVDILSDPARITPTTVTPVHTAIEVDQIVKNALQAVKPILSESSEFSSMLDMSPGGWAPAGASARMAPIQVREDKVRRILDVLLAGTVAPRGRVALTATIRREGSTATGQWQSVIDIDRGQGPITFHVDAVGFALRSVNDVQQEVPPEADAPPVAFVFEVLESRERSITLVLHQEGKFLTQVAITQFVLSSISRQQPLPQPSETDLSVFVQTDNHVQGYSPRNKANFSGHSFGVLKLPDPALLQKLQASIHTLYKGANPEEVERELRLLGQEIANCLPQDLCALLSSGRIRSLFLQHPIALDFPFELALLEDEHEEFFLADRMVICRWLTGIDNSPLQGPKEVKKVALLKGKVSTAAAEHSLLNEVFPPSVDAFGDHHAVISRVFQTADYDLLHFLGHCRYDDPAQIAVELETGEIRLREIGALRTERVFRQASPLVIFNACRTAGLGWSLAGRESFATRFLQNNVSGFVGTLWPVEGRIAHEFSRSFYQQLKEEPIAGAVLKSRQELSTATHSLDGTPLSAAEQVWRRITLRSYCVFAHPQTSVAFPKSA